MFLAQPYCYSAFLHALPGSGTGFPVTGPVQETCHDYYRFIVQSKATGLQAGASHLVPGAAGAPGSCIGSRDDDPLADAQA